jgi:hypothetical protein
MAEISEIRGIAGILGSPGKSGGVLEALQGHKFFILPLFFCIL